MNRDSKRKIHRIVHEGRERHGEKKGTAEMGGIFNFCPYLISLVASILPINGDSVKKLFFSSDRILLTKFSTNCSKEVISTKNCNLWQAQELKPVCGGGARLGWLLREKHLLYSHKEYVSWNRVVLYVKGLGCNRLGESAAWWTGLGWQKGWGLWAWRWRWNHISNEIP